ncbi:MAG: hypothetical protein L3K14_04435 [Thermoplasmata archaeon]|nr:hypothetical protein [Thermoplasmata archaeon]
MKLRRWVRGAILRTNRMAPADVGAAVSGKTTVDPQSNLMTAAGAPATPPPEKPGSSWNGRNAIDLLRIGAGIVWLLNLIFIVNPQNQFWSKFSTTALSYAPTTLGGPGLAQYVAAHSTFFAWSIALFTGYMAVALLLGFTTRIACFTGSFFSAVLLATQFGTTYLFPGGTDVGAHPLYLLVYGVLVVGGAGRSLSADLWLRNILASRRARQIAVGRPAPHPSTFVLTPRTLFAYFVVGTLLSLGVGFGLVFVLPSAPAAASGTPPVGPVHFVNLTVAIDPANGWPQYSPANFTVPVGRVVITIFDNDMPVSWSSCPCPVRGTIDGLELLNGTPIGNVPGTNVAHTFNIPAIGLQILSPGQSVVQFTVDLTRAGELIWYCFAPCGTGPNPYNSAPMNVPGYMTGTVTVT